MKSCIIAIIVLTMPFGSETSRILAVFSTPSISHQVVFRPLTQELARRGHEVVVITPDPAFPPGRTPPNLTEIDVHDVSYQVWKNEAKEFVLKKNNSYEQIKQLLQMLKAVFDAQVRIKEVSDIVKNKKGGKFDLIIIEGCIRPAAALYHVYKAPIVLISSFGPLPSSYKIMGVPMHPLLYPTAINQRLYNLSQWEIVKELYHRYTIFNFYRTYEVVVNEQMKRHFGEDTPSLTELYNNVDMTFLNAHYIYLDNPPVPLGLIYLRGLHIQPAKELPQALESLLNNSKNGVIYVSFGTNVETSRLPSDKIEMMANVFTELPYEVLWKWDGKEIPIKHEGITFSKWFPQADLLKHPNVKAFVMQGGLQSTDEAITAGVPLICLPLLIDQWFNAEKYVHHKFGIQLEWYSLTEEEFRRSILAVIEDNSYRRNIQHFRNLLNDQPQQPLERAVSWVEHMLRHGGAKHLRAPAANMPWTQYYELELVLLIFTTSIIIVHVSYLLICYVYKLLLNRLLRF